MVNLEHSLGMATGRVQARFFHIRTRPAGLSQKSEPGPFIKRVFFLTPNPPRRASTGPAGLVPHAQPSPKSETQTSIYDFPAQNHKHKHKSKHNHKHKHRNPKHKFWIYDFPFQNHNHKHKLTLRIWDAQEKRRRKRWRSNWSEAVRPWARKMIGEEGCATVRTNEVETYESREL